MPPSLWGRRARAQQPKGLRQRVPPPSRIGGSGGRGWGGGPAFAAAAGGRGGRGAGGAKSRAGPRRAPSGAGFGLRQRAGLLSPVSEPLRRTLSQ